MIEILVYAFSIMYTPGPVNLLSLNAGLQGLAPRTLGFCAGVGLAMWMMFLLFGYGGALLPPLGQAVIGLLGCGYIFWLAIKLVRMAISSGGAVGDATTGARAVPLSLRTGLLMQLCNPKAPVAILPIATVQFPAAGITGSGILLWSVLLGAMAFGAPGSYLLLGSKLGRLIQTRGFFRGLNLMMALMLIYVAIDIGYSQLQLLLAG